MDDTTVLDELKREAKRRGHIALTMPQHDFALWAMYVAGIAVGFIIASRTR
jgi:hypothetical protein